ncbi:GNAT family N-acetyltransferase [Deminuibacter soli]|uniref:N-acetyltransferase n=1 Tax=Deminuibacter soli TaxID=2291815 RepID=A0A3E1NLS3_9BACT|nr:GNAT family protein [Deminuibacter soli]RFM28890.1 N-acetyltransferase [Deminuibacter soli]
MTADFNFTTNYILEDDCVKLRPLQLEDMHTLTHFALTEPELWRFSLVSAAGEKGMEAYIHHAVRARLEQKEYPFIVYDKRSKQYAGCTRFYDMQLSNKTLQLGYTWYGKAFQGTGLNRHCKFLLLQFAFEQLGMERVEFRADANNARSIAAMKAIGCTPEGILRNHMPLASGGRRDSIVLSILRNEWLEGGVKQQLQAKLV